MGGLEVYGLENLPYRGPAIVAANHTSLADPWILCAACPVPLRTLAAEDLYANKALAWYISHMGAIPIRRNAADPDSLARARGALAQGAMVLIFPEGRISPDGRPLPWLAGTAVLALRSGAPVIPVIIEGANRLLPLGTFRPRRQRLRFHYLPAIQGELRSGERIRDQVERFRLRLQEAWLEGYRRTSGQTDGAASGQLTCR